MNKKTWILIWGLASAICVYIGIQTYSRISSAAYLYQQIDNPVPTAFVFAQYIWFIFAVVFAFLAIKKYLNK